MDKQAGVFTATKKDKTIYYRASITFHSKHISLGSYRTAQEAHRVYNAAKEVLNSPKLHSIDAALEITSYKPCPLPFHKWVTLINFRDNGIYIKNPVYLLKKYFLYFLEADKVLKFSVDDLFYYSKHKILQKNNYLYVNDYGSQISILSRYGIRPYAQKDRDYYFVNGDCWDFRYGNIRIKNQYFGVEEVSQKGVTRYKAKIHLNGNYVIGTYATAAEAAIAYNKAANLLKTKGISKDFPTNYLEDLSPIDYAALYNRVKISKRIRNFL